MLSQALTLFTTPVVYLYLDRFEGRRKKRKDGKKGKADGAEAKKDDPKPDAETGGAPEPA